jgi:hypothetical protein
VSIPNLVLAAEAAGQAAAEQFRVSRTTLQRHRNDYNESGTEQFFYGNKCAVFSTQEDAKLRGCIATGSHIHYGLTRREVMKLAYQFAKELTKSITTRGM